MSAPKDNVKREPLVYVCGEANLNTPSGSPSLRDIVIRNLVTSWAIRTHPVTDILDPRQDTSAELFQTIPRASVFVFIFSKKTIEDSYFLNQYGIAKSYNIPVVGMRLTNYFLRSTLPDQYYRTEIVDNSGESILDSKRPAETTTSLAEHLIADFKNAMVYGPDFHKSCIERLNHRVAKAYTTRENEKTFLEHSEENMSNGSVLNKQQQDKANAPTKCPKCGFIFPKVSPPKLQRASSTGSLLRRSNTYDHLPLGTSSLKTTMPRNRTPLQPTTIQIPSPQVVKQPRKAETLHYGNWTTKLDNNKKLQVEPKIQPRASSVSSSESAREETNPPPPPPKPDENPKVFRRQSRVSNGSWTEKLRNKLRRQSSLPVIPTTYLVTTPDGFEKQISLVRYPPEKREPSSPRGTDSGSVFSEDEDQETIHISRVPSPDAPSG